MSVKDMLFGGDSGSSLKNKYSSRAVSPVIGVILMVVITVILAGVISVAVLDFGGEVNEGAPTASFDGDIDTAGDTATFTHQQGDELAGDDMTLFVAGQPVAVPSGTYSVGSQFTVDTAGSPAINSGDDIRLVYDDGQGNTATLYTGEAP